MKLLITLNPSGVAYIRSPVAGIIGDVLMNSGAWMNRGAALATIVEPGGRELRIDVPENLISGVETELSVSAILNGVSWTGTLDRIEAQLDSRTLTLPAYSILPDSISAVAGSFVMAEIQFSYHGAAVTSVPERAVLSLGERSIVYVDLGESRYVPRVVQIGELSFDENSEPFFPVLDGLLSGERVVLDGAFLLDSQAELTGITSLMNRGDGL